MRLLELLNRTALPTIQSSSKADDDRTLIKFYHQGVYERFHLENITDIRSAYFQTPRLFRLDNLKAFVGDRDFVFGDEAWSACRSYLECVEDKLKTLVERRTAPEWLHLYRRLGVALHPGLGNKVDDATTGLVREIAELAMEKHGSTTKRPDLSEARMVSGRDILGGLYLKDLRGRLGNKRAAAEETRNVIRSNQLVITRFGYDDLFDLYRIEGMSYEYWRTTAALRRIGKGAGIRRNDSDFLDYSSDENLNWLVEHYDESNSRTRFSGSLIGSWFPERSNTSEPIDVLVAGYNVYGVKFGDICDGFELIEKCFPRNFEPNFYLSKIDLSSFVDANEFIGAEFQKRSGFNLLDCAHCLRALSMQVIVPLDKNLLRRVSVPQESVSPAFVAILNLAQRGYGVFKGSHDDLAKSLSRTISVLGPSIDSAALDLCIRYMTLTANSRALIGLWSRGRRFPLLPIPGGFVIDLEAIGGFLLTLFVRTVDRNGMKGLSFERMWRLGLANAKFDIALVGEIVSQAGPSREVDAGVRIGSDLYLMECRAIERPLDYEIGKPSVLAQRREQLLEKLNQVESLRDFLVSHPSGTNYDVRWAKRILSFVVSPFSEFIWTRDARFWHGNFPRITGADKMLQILEAARSSQQLPLIEKPKPALEGD